MTLPALVLTALELLEWGLSQTHVMIMVESLYFKLKCGQCDSFVTSDSSETCHCCSHWPQMSSRRSGSALVQVIACCLFSAKPSSEPMLANCQLDSWEQISMKYRKREFYHFHSRKCIWNCLPKLAAILSRMRWVKHFQSTNIPLVLLLSFLSHRILININCKNFNDQNWLL